MPDGAAPAFMHASGPWETTKVWQCDDCEQGGDWDFEDDQAPRNHVMETGHSVTLTKITEMTLFSYATKPPG